MPFTPTTPAVTCTHPDVPSVSADLADHFLSWLANNEDRWPLWLNLDAEIEPMAGWADGGDPEELTVDGIREAMRACACPYCDHLPTGGLRPMLKLALIQGSLPKITKKSELVSAILQVALWGRVLLDLSPETEEDEDWEDNESRLDLEDQVDRALARGDAQDARTGNVAR